MMMAGLLAGCRGPASETSEFQSVRSPVPPRAGVTTRSSPQRDAPARAVPRVGVSEAPRGRVVSVNASLRFVVIDFGLGRMPSVGTRWGVYRGGLKVGEVKITGPQEETNIVGDITSGDARSEDEVRLE